MSLQQLCTAFDTQPWTLLWPGNILPSCPQPCTRCLSAVPLHVLCSSTAEHSIHLHWLHSHESGCNALTSGSQWGHILYPLTQCQRERGISQIATCRKTGELPTSNCILKETAENKKYFPCFLFSWDWEVTHKNLWLLLRETNCAQ